MVVVNPMVVEAGLVHVLAPYVKERLERGFDSRFFELNMDFSRWIMGVKGAHGAPRVVQANVARDLNFLSEHGDVDHGVVMFSQSRMSTNALIGEGMPFVGGVERRLSIALSQQKTKAGQSTNRDDEPNQRFLVHVAHQNFLPFSF
jgi:hypothetical protein